MNMRNSPYPAPWLPALLLLALCAVTGRAADPGGGIPAASELNDQKTGSVLIFNFYTSSALNPASENSKFNLTNHNPGASAFIHLIFVNGSSGAPADSFICLTANQTVTFLASDVDPGTRGFLVAVAIGSGNGCPVNFNFLSGEAAVKMASGHAANLAAEAIAAIAANPTTCMAGQTSATLNFDGVNYNRLPRLLALDKIRNLADNNSMLLILNRIGGNIATCCAATLGTINGELLDDMSNVASFNFTGAPQRVQTLSDTFPATVPVFSAMIPVGRTGWMTLSSPSDIGLLGALINFNPNSFSNAAAFLGGHNLRKLTLSTTNSLIVPVFTPVC